MNEYIIEMLNITKEFPGIVANDNITLQLKKGEIHALLGENGAGKSTLMSVLFGLYQPEKGEIRKNGEVVRIKDPNDANALGIGMVHQHFKLVEVFSVLDNIILGVEPAKGPFGVLSKGEARKKVMELSERYGLMVDPDAIVEDIEPTAVLTPQEIDELMKIMKGLAAEGKSILFITHKLDEIKQVADRCTVLRKGRYIGTVNVAETSKEEMSEMMVGRKVQLVMEKKPITPGESVLSVQNLTVRSKTNNKALVNNVSFNVRRGEIVCIAGIDGNGQSELVYTLSGIMKQESGHIFVNNKDVTHMSIRERNTVGLSHIPEDRHKHGLVLDYSLENNFVLKQYYGDRFAKHGFLNFKAIRQYAENLIEKFDVRSGQGAITRTRSMSGGNQQKAIIAREIDLSNDLLIAVQPTRGLDVGAIEYIRKELLAQRDAGKAVLLVSLELDEVLEVPDRILVMYEGEIVGELDPKHTTAQELGLYMAGAQRNV